MKETYIFGAKATAAGLYKALSFLEPKKNKSLSGVGCYRECSRDMGSICESDFFCGRGTVRG